MDSAAKNRYSPEEIRSKMQKVTRSDGSTVTFFEDESGSICSTVYVPFDGVSLVQKDVHMPQFVTNWRYGPVNAMAIEYCREGCLECLIGDDYLYVTPGDLVIFRTDPNLRVISYPSSHYYATTLMIYFDETSPMINLHMGDEGFRPEMLVEKYLSGERYHSLLQKNELLTNVFETLSAAPEPVKNKIYGLKILEALTLLASDIAKINDSHGQRIPKDQADMAKRVYTYVMDHPEERFSIETLAKNFSISPTQLKKYFQMAYGMPMQKFLREQKIKEAAKVLETTGKSVTDVAQMFGYSNISKFSDAFKSVMGENPKQYRLHYYAVAGHDIKNV